MFLHYFQLVVVANGATTGALINRKPNMFVKRVSIVQIGNFAHTNGQHTAWNASITQPGQNDVIGVMDGNKPFFNYNYGDLPADGGWYVNIGNNTGVQVTFYVDVELYEPITNAKYLRSNH